MQKMEQAVGRLLRELLPLFHEYMFSDRSEAGKSRKEQMLTTCYQKIHR